MIKNVSMLQDIVDFIFSGEPYKLYGFITVDKSLLNMYQIIAWRYEPEFVNGRWITHLGRDFVEVEWRGLRLDPSIDFEDCLFSITAKEDSQRKCCWLCDSFKSCDHSEKAEKCGIDWYYTLNTYPDRYPRSVKHLTSNKEIDLWR